MGNTAQPRTLARHSDECGPFNPRAAVLWVCFALCVLLAGWIVVETAFSTSSDHREWPLAALAIAAVAATLIALSRTLPLQNVLLVATVIGLLEGFTHPIGTLIGIPFAPRFGTSPWWIPLIWIIAVLNSRGTAQLILRPWHRMQNYGFWMMGVTIVLCLVFDFGLELFAAIKGYWVWNPSHAAREWQAVPPGYFLVQAISVLVMLIAVTPFLINKKPVEFPSNYHPWFLWTLLNLVFLAGTLAGHFRLAAVFISGATLVTVIFALRGAKA